MQVKLLHFGQKKIGFHLTMALAIHSYVTIRSTFEEVRSSLTLADTAAIFSSVCTLRRRVSVLMSNNVNLVRFLVTIARIAASVMNFLNMAHILIIKFNDLLTLFVCKTIHG